jgi:hypothetical protein
VKCSHCKLELEDQNSFVSFMYYDRHIDMTVHTGCLKELVGEPAFRKLSQALARVGWTQLLLPGLTHEPGRN